MFAACVLAACVLAAGSSLLAPANLPSLTVKHEPFVSLEHVNLNAGPRWTPELQRFWFEVLGAADDPRGLQIASEVTGAGGSMTGLHWANVGLQQFHLPVGEPENATQVLRGEMALAYTAEELDGVRARLQAAEIPFEALGDGALRCRCPFGNLLRLEPWPSDRAQSWFGPAPVMDPRVERPLPGGPTSGLGMRWVRFDTPQGAAAPICDFYREMFGAQAELLTDEDGHALCRVPIGFEQALEFRELAEGAPPLSPYDGHHVAVYTNRFDDIYERLAAHGLVWNNPRFPHLTYDTLDDALRHNEFRIHDIVDPQTGAVIYTLEHEVRSLLHRGFSCRHWVEPRGAAMGTTAEGSACETDGENEADGDEESSLAQADYY
eukprot:2554642-Prymnesium_polylepis.1